MGRYIIRRLLLMIPVIIGASFLIFAMVYALPGDPIRALSGDRPFPPAVEQALREKYNLDDDLHIQYFKYLGGLLQGDLGEDFRGKEVAAELSARLPNTLKLGLVAFVIEVVFGITAGALAGWRQGGFFDSATMILTIIVISIPVVVLAFGAQYLFALKLGWFPVAGVNDGFRSFLLPGIMLGAISLAYITRLTRSSLAENLRNDYVRTARAKGLSPSVVLGRHTLRNSLIPVVTFLGADLGALMGGAVITEGVFNIPGVGLYVLNGVKNQEGPVVVGTVTVMVFAFIIGILLSDVLTALLDPRIRLD